MNDTEKDAKRYRVLIRNIAITHDSFKLYFPKGWQFDIHAKDYVDGAMDFLITMEPERHAECARHCAIYLKHDRPSCSGFCAYREGECHAAAQE